MVSRRTCPGMTFLMRRVVTSPCGPPVVAEEAGRGSCHEDGRRGACQMHVGPRKQWMHLWSLGTTRAVCVVGGGGGGVEAGW